MALNSNADANPSMASPSMIMTKFPHNMEKRNLQHANHPQLLIMIKRNGSTRRMTVWLGKQEDEIELLKNKVAHLQI